MRWRAVRLGPVNLVLTVSPQSIDNNSQCGTWSHARTGPIRGPVPGEELWLTDLACLESRRGGCEVTPTAQTQTLGAEPPGKGVRGPFSPIRRRMGEGVTRTRGTLRPEFGNPVHWCHPGCSPGSLSSCPSGWFFLPRPHPPSRGASGHQNKAVQRDPTTLCRWDVLLL